VAFQISTKIRSHDKKSPTLRLRRRAGRDTDSMPSPHALEPTEREVVPSG